MKKAKWLLSLLLLVSLLFSCFPACAEDAQPCFSLTEESFLAWYKNYNPDAAIEWETWKYSPSFLTYDGSVRSSDEPG